MHESVSFNHQITLAENAVLNADSSAFLYGKSIFTTIAVYHFKPFLWEKHWTRLISNAEQIGLDLSNFTQSSVFDSLLQIIAKNDFQTGRARLTFYDASPPLIWQNSSKKSKSGTGFLIQTAELRQIKSRLNLMVSPFSVNSQSLLVGVKSGNYLENIVAWEKAKADGFDEAIRLNERGEIAAACLANVFWKKDNVIFTPSLKTGCLNGTTRQYMLENLRVEETEASLDEIFEADEIFLTSAGIGVAPAAIVR